MTIALDRPTTTTSEADDEHETFLPAQERAAEPEAAPTPVDMGVSRDAVLTVVGSIASALGLGVLLTVVLGIIPVGWLFITSFICFVIVYTSLIALHERGPAVRDRFWTIMLWAAAVTVGGSLALVIGFTFILGGDVWQQAFDPESSQPLWERAHFLTQDMSGVGPLAELDKGGILHAIVGTLIQITVAIAITVPLGLTTALFLAEVGGRFARFVRTIVEAMTALPSVVAGLFIYAAVIVLFTRQYNGFAASLAITVLMLPIMIRSADVVLRLVPGNLREAGLALGANRWQVVWRVVLPTVRSGLTTAVILAVAHGIGETAPVLLTAGVTSNLNANLFDGPMTSLPLAALEFIKSPQNSMKARGFATAAVLLLLVLILFLIARKIGGQEAGNLTPGQRAKLSRTSRETQRRMVNAPAAAVTQLNAAESAASPATDDFATLKALGQQLDEAPRRRRKRDDGGSAISPDAPTSELPDPKDAP